jgi:hypothetical protein
MARPPDDAPSFGPRGFVTRREARGQIIERLRQFREGRSAIFIERKKSASFPCPDARMPRRARQRARGGL